MTSKKIKIILIVNDETLNFSKEKLLEEITGNAVHLPPKEKKYHPSNKIPYNWGAHLKSQRVSKTPYYRKHC
ncbi:MAG: hypothetical protein KKE23_02500 [Nanoarchaeota archaeon]|nr:hypothetical protein [Nanoarchaeota archaeon]